MKILIAEDDQGVSDPVDMARLDEIMGDDLFEIVDLYLEEMSRHLEELTVAIAAGNAGNVDLIAHNCVGTSANCGMVAVVAPLRELEKAGRDCQLDNALPLLKEIKRQFARINEFLETNVALPVA